jgi:hypothetical protein
MLWPMMCSRPPGQWRDDDYDVLEGGVVVGRIFTSPATPEDHGDMRRAAHG